MTTKDVLTNLSNYSCFDFKHYPMSKEEADVCIEALKEKIEREEGAGQ